MLMEYLHMGQIRDINKAVLFSLLAAASMSIMALFVKLAAPHTNNNMTVFFRFTISFIYIAAIIVIKIARGQSFPYKTQHLPLHLFRASVSVATMMLFYYSLRYIPLIDGNLLIMTNALFIPILGIFILKKITGGKHWLAVLLGFIGIALLLKPGHDLFNPLSLIALSAGLASAMAYIAIRAISRYDHPYTSMLYYFPLAFIVSGIISIFHWQTPDLHTSLLLLCVGIFGTFYQEFLIRASRYASSKIISSLMYTSVVFSGLFGFTIFGEIPDILSAIGIVLVFAGCLLTIKFA